MSINGTSSGGKVSDISNFEEISKSDIQNIRKKNLQDNIEEKLNEKGFLSFLKRIFNPKRTIALKNLRDNLNGTKSLSEASLYSKYLPKSTQKLFNDYLDLFEEFKETLSQDEFEKIWENKQSKPIGEGGFGVVYQSEDGKYALKVPKEGKSMEEDLKGNEALKNNEKAFDASQCYYKENAGFITKYVGTFKTQDGKDVSVFEKIEGKDFSKYKAENMSLQCRFLAQAATAIAISHEAGCINSDIKPANMMINTKNKENPLLKLIDQGAVINLTEREKYATCCTPPYAAPELISSNKPSPASDVFSLGVTILEKLAELPNATQNIKGLKTLVMFSFSKEYLKELDKDSERYSRENVSKNIAQLCEHFNVLENKEESKFIGLLLKDCLAFKAEDRISAAQAGEILQTFSSYLEAKGKDASVHCPDYNVVKTETLQDCPKGIPIALREMLFSSDTKIQKKGISIIRTLVKRDPSYKKTPSYGFILLLKSKSNEVFKSWATENKESVQWLKERTYIQGENPKDKQDMPVSKKIYEIIQNLKIE